MKNTTVQPRGCTNFKTRQLSRLLSRHYDSELAKAGLKTTQYSLLTHVLRLGPITPGELARQMGLDASTLTRNMQPMVASGWVLQDPGSDARSRSISITAEGRDKQSEAQQHWKVAQRNINAILGVGRVNALHQLLDDCLPLLEGHGSSSP
jgi:DNA-binding MarR family transcriptional regulator